MFKRNPILLLVILSAFLSCSGNGRSGRDEASLLDILAAVPSDAVSVASADRLEDLLPLVDSSSALGRLRYASFSDSPAILSRSYTGALVPLLTVGTGEMEQSEVSALRSRASREGLFSEFFPRAEGRQAVLSITPSETVLNSVRRHVHEGRSIKDAPDFTEAALLPSDNNFLILRNSAAGNLVTNDFLGGIYPRRRAAAFVKTLSSWTIISPSGNGSYTLRASSPENEVSFASLFLRLPAAPSRLGEILPDSVDFALSLQLRPSSFRPVYEEYKDATVKKVQYLRELSSLASSRGKDPLKWELEADVREVALMRWRGEIFALYRSGKKLADAPAGDNPYPSFLPALYGMAFAADDESCCATVHGWTVIGSREGVDLFYEEMSGREKYLRNPAWPGGACRFVLYDGAHIATDEDNTVRIWNSTL